MKYLKLTILPKLTPWWLLYFIDKHSSYCWARMVMWKLGYEQEWTSSSDCELDEGVCYCGKVSNEIP